MPAMASNDSPAAVRPTGIVTFLFTDIEGSTGRWEAQTTEMGAALARHDDTLRTAIDAHGGWMFKHTGDGVLAAFPSPNGAVAAAIDAQRALELPVRMGIATGEAEQRGDDYFGPTLNRAARIMAAGHGGQVLLAQSTASMLTGIDLLDLGERRLRDLSGAQRIFQVRAEGLREQFPPLRTVDTVPGNLPAQQTSFVGREGEVAQLVELVRAHRMVTLTGVGGVGKTRLAVQVAAELVPDFPDGVWLVELAPVGDPAAVPDAVATALGMTQQAGLTVTASIAKALTGRRLLVVLDNCEHLLDAAADLVEAIMARSATTKVIATSREGLRLGAEHLWAVPSLDLGGGVTSAAVELFVERARSVVAAFGLKDEADVAAATETCRRLDGIPLAIELAAARMVSMTAQDVCDRLGDRFRLLAGGRRGLERHQTLRHAVQWSYELLNDDERSVLNRCSVFAGGFDLASVTHLRDGFDEYAVLDLLDSLVRKSLVTVERGGGHTRYGMLETIRQFAEDQLVATGAIDEVRDRHARYFAGEVEVNFERFASPRQGAAVHWLSTEKDNLRAAFRWALDRDDLETAADFSAWAGCMGPAVNWFEPVEWAEELLLNPRAGELRKLRWLYASAALCVLVGRGDDAIRYARAGLAIDEPGYDLVANGLDYFALANAYFMTGKIEAGIETCRAGVERSNEPLPQLRSAEVMGLATIGRLDEAMALADVALASAQASGVPASIAMAFSACGATLAQADPVRALVALRQARLAARLGRLKSAEALAARVLGRLESLYGDPLAGLSYFDDSIDLFHESGSTVHVRATLLQLAVTFDQTNRASAAATLYGASSDNAFALAFVPQLPAVAAHLCEVLGEETFERLSREGAAMDLGDAVRYAHEQIQLVRAELVGASAPPLNQRAS